jgi:UDP-glucuronate decarboxylase
MHLEKRILVTGGAGFLGSHLCERLVRGGARVICLDNFFTGAHRNLDELKDHKAFELMRHDVTFPLYVEVKAARAGRARRRRRQLKAADNLG